MPKRSAHSEKFRNEAVSLFLDYRNAKAVCALMGIDPRTLRKWVNEDAGQQHQSPDAPSGATHEIEGLFFKVTERGLFRFDGFEWVRSSMSLRELKNELSNSYKG